MSGMYVVLIFLCIFGLVFEKKWCLSPANFSYQNKQNNTSRSLYYIIVLALYFFLITSNATGKDIVVYYNRYVYTRDLYISPEFIYNYLAILFYNLGFSFYVFRAVLTFVSGCLAYLTLRKLNANICFVVFLSLPSIIFMDSMQVRNSICVYLLIWALGFLLSENKNSTLLYILSIALMTLIHTAFIFYILLLIVKLHDETIKKIVLGFLVLASVFLILITFLNGNYIPFIEELLSAFLGNGDDRSVRYLTSGHYGFLYPLMLHLFNLGLMYSLKKDILEMSIKEQKLFEIIFTINLISMLLVPFIMMNMNYYRYLRTAFVVSLIGYSVFLYKKLDTIKIVFLIIITALWAIFELYIYDTIENIVMPVLRDGGVFFSE